MERKKKIKNMALCGGGIFGYGEVGSIVRLLEGYQDYMAIKKIKGVSVGSMVAALFAVGYTPQELSKILFELNFDALIRGNAMIPYLKIYDKWGMYEADGLENEIEKFIRQKTNIKFCTFSQIDIDLTIIATNLNYQNARLFNRELAPDMVISKAVRMSISYPGVIRPVFFEGDWYGDGGESINYPIITFPDEELEETIGITFAAFNENDNGTLKNRVHINDIYDYIKSLAMTMSRATYIAQITKKYLDRSIIIKITEDVNSMQFNLTPQQKQFIYQCGFDAVDEQIEKILGIPSRKDNIINLVTNQPIVNQPTITKQTIIKPIESETDKSQEVQTVPEVILILQETKPESITQ